MEHMIYLKMEQSIRTRERRIRLKDLASVSCAVPSIKTKVENIRLLDLPDGRKEKNVVSVLYVIGEIDKTLAGEKDGYHVVSVGEQDCVISRMPEKSSSRPLQYIQAAFVGLTVFFGAAFAIMTYNEDVDVRGVFEKMYTVFSGHVPESGGILELTYSIGIGIGLLVFFGHFEWGKRQKDPTPMEVQMRQYEEDVIATVVDASARRGRETDVE